MLKILLMLCLVCYSISAVELQKVTVIDVIDGDTYWVQDTTNKFKIRLARADTPETSKISKTYKDAYLELTTLEYQVARGKDITKAVTSCILNSNIWLYPDNPKNKDRYGRPMYWVFLEDKVDVETSLNCILMMSFLAKPSYIELPLPNIIQQLGVRLDTLKRVYDHIYLLNIEPEYRLVFAKDVLDSLDTEEVTND